MKTFLKEIQASNFILEKTSFNGDTAIILGSGLGKFSEIFCKDDFYKIEIDQNNQCRFSCLPIWAKDTNMKFTISNAKLDSY